jgi:hypothetical protein
MMLRQIMLTQCADRALHAPVESTNSAKNSLSLLLARLYSAEWYDNRWMMKGKGFSWETEKATGISLRIVGVLADNRTKHPPKTSPECCR